MRKLFATTVAAGLLLGTTASLSAQVVLPPLPMRPAIEMERPVPVGLAAHYYRVTSREATELLPIAALRVLLRERGFDGAVTAGPMTATPPGGASTEVPYGLDTEVDTLIGARVASDAWLVQTPVGRWWVWEYGAAAPADERARVYDVHARATAGAEGRVSE